MVRRITGPEILTRAEVAQVLEVHPSTVTRWATTGLVSYFRTPAGERRYHRREVQDFLNQPPERLAPHNSGHGSQRVQANRRALAG
ncbi:MAG TPA: helix-turn-helix domain-containing protein [Streptosporangiaceae bacterium]|nr:helix-turn-helix domain-containing protein [Streptosporangiaceae bacterium]